MTRKTAGAWLVLLLTVLVSFRLHAQVGYDRLLGAAKEARNWLVYSGGYFSNRYSELTQITTANAKNLELSWMYQAAVAGAWQTTPLVVDGIMYLTQRPNDVVALDARTGRVFWIYRHPPTPDQIVCCGANNRGLAILGDTLYMGTLDAHLVAINAKSGRPIWNTQVAESKAGYSLTLAPLAVKDKIIVGVGGGEYGIRGFVAAFDARTGREAWRFYTIPAPGEPGGDSWKPCPAAATTYCDPEAWKHGGGSVWVTGSFDASLNLTYWGVGNAGPDWNNEQRPGDNLYTDSVVALDADTGRLKWHYQFTPNDRYDYDSVQVPVLADITWRGAPLKAMMWANRNGNYYCSSGDGRFLVGKPPVKELDGHLRRARASAPDVEAARHDVAGQSGRHELVLAVLQPPHRPLLHPGLGRLRDDLRRHGGRISGRAEFRRRRQPAVRAGPGRPGRAGDPARSHQQLDRGGGERRRAGARCRQRRAEVEVCDDRRDRQRYPHDGLGSAVHRRARRIFPGAGRPDRHAALEGQSRRADRERTDHVRGGRKTVRRDHRRPLAVRVYPARVADATVLLGKKPGRAGEPSHETDARARRCARGGGLAGCAVASRCGRQLDGPAHA
jgi:PQQ-dependent dehydrogenase (methanol/ethanol family)